MHVTGDLEEGAIVGIVIASLVGVGVACTVIWCYCRSKKRKSTATEPAVVNTSPIVNAESSSSPADIPGAVNGNLPPSYEMAVSLQGTQGVVFAPVPLSQPNGAPVMGVPTSMGAAATPSTNPTKQDLNMQQGVEPLSSKPNPVDI